MEVVLCFKYYHYQIILSNDNTITVEKVYEKARRRRRSDPDFLQIPPPLQKTKKRDKGGVSVAKPRDSSNISEKVLQKRLKNILEYNQFFTS